MCLNNIPPLQETAIAVSKPQDWQRQFPLKAGSTGGISKYNCYGSFEAAGLAETVPAVSGN